MSEPAPEPDPDLTEPPGDDGDADAEINDLEAEGRSERESVREATARATGAVADVADSVETRALRDLATANDLAGGPGDAYEPPGTVGVGDDAPSKDLKALTEAVSKLSEDMKKQPEKAKEWSTKRTVALMLGGTVAGAGIYLLVKYLQQVAKDNKTDDLPAIPDEAKDDITKLVKDWKDQPDKEYWKKLADYIDNNPAPPKALSTMDQALFLKTTESLCPADAVFIWDTEQDKADFAQALVNEVTAQKGKTSAMYRLVITKTYQDAPLTRAAAADVLLLAICWLYHLQVGHGK